MSTTWIYFTIGIIIFICIVIWLYIYIHTKKYNQLKSSTDNASVYLSQGGTTTESKSGAESKSYGKSAGHHTMEYSYEKCPMCGWKSEKTYSDA